MRAALEVFAAFGRLGLTSFGGPVAHIGYFREEFVERRKWLQEAEFAEIVALAQFLPGPASSQAGMIIGHLRAGQLGMLAAWLAFTLPSALALTLFALWERGASADPHHGWLHGLLLAAVAVVAQAVWAMRVRLAPDGPRIAIAFIAATLALTFPAPFTQIAIIGGAALFGRFAFRAAPPPAEALPLPRGSSRVAAGAALAFFSLLLALPLLRTLTHSDALALADTFYRTGAFVFGGGHVVLPLLEAPVVGQGWVDATTFLAGYGATQAVPGPLFTFAAYLGAINTTAAAGWGGAAIALGAIFLPSFLLITAVLPVWGRLRTGAGFGPALHSVNAAVVGLLLAALFNPVWVNAVHAPADAIVALGAFVLLGSGRMRPWAIVAVCASAAELAHL